MRSITTEIGIAAPPETVWAVLTDFPADPEWNPFIISLEGNAEVGERFKTRMQPPGGKAMTFKPKVAQKGDLRVFQWLGSLGIKGIFDGRHSFRIGPTEHGTRFEQSEQFTGILVGLLLRMIGDRTEAGFHAMNQALKERSESPVS